MGPIEAHLNVRHNDFFLRVSETGPMGPIEARIAIFTLLSLSVSETGPMGPIEAASPRCFRLRVGLMNHPTARNPIGMRLEHRCSSERRVNCVKFRGRVGKKSATSS